jgi:hypothetical protein
MARSADTIATIKGSLTGGISASRGAGCSVVMAKAGSVPTIVKTPTSAPVEPHPRLPEMSYEAAPGVRKLQLAMLSGQYQNSIRRD